MPHRFRTLLALVLFLVAVIPAVAAEQVERVPAIRQIERARFEIAITVDGQPALIGRGETIVPNRQHYVVLELDENNDVVTKREIVIVEGVLYVRENDSDVWETQIYTLPFNDPTIEISAPAFDASPALFLGSTEIAGVAVDQYRAIFDADEQGNATASIDVWIGKQQNYAYQAQTFELQRFSSGQTTRVEFVSRSFDFNDPTIQIGKPQGPNIAPIQGPVPWSAQLGTLGAATARKSLAARLLAER